jgi:hypothetical protein
MRVWKTGSGSATSVCPLGALPATSAVWWRTSGNTIRKWDNCTVRDLNLSSGIRCVSKDVSCPQPPWCEQRDSHTGKHQTQYSSLSEIELSYFTVCRYNICGKNYTLIATITIQVFRALQYCNFSSTEGSNIHVISSDIVSLSKDFKLNGDCIVPQKRCMGRQISKDSNMVGIWLVSE